MADLRRWCAEAMAARLEARDEVRKYQAERQAIVEAIVAHFDAIGGGTPTLLPADIIREEMVPRRMLSATTEKAVEGAVAHAAQAWAIIDNALDILGHRGKSLAWACTHEQEKARAEREGLRQRLREATYLIVDVIGGSGPMNLEEAIKALLAKLDVVEGERDRARAWRRCADALADEADVLVRRKVVDSRSPLADALLDYREVPSTPRSRRMVELERENALLREHIAALVPLAESNSTDDGGAECGGCGARREFNDECRPGCEVLAAKKAIEVTTETEKTT